MTEKHIMLTAAAVRRLKPGPERREILDGGCRGLFLTIQPSGVKSWTMRFRRPGGKHAKLTLGRWTDVDVEGGPVLGAPLTLAMARQLATEIHRRRVAGEDVVGAHKLAKAHRALVTLDAERNIFPTAARDYFLQYAKPNMRNTRDLAGVLGLTPDGASTVPGGLCERWADRAVADISGDDIWLMVEEARHSGVPGRAVRCTGPSESRAREMHGVLSQLFGWLLRKRRIKANPCGGLERPAPPPGRERVLIADATMRGGAEIKWFWHAAGALSEPFGTFVKLLLLTGARRREVAQMTCDELSEDFATWTLPGTRTKNGKPHIVPLPNSARTLLAALIAGEPPRQAEAPAYLFTTTGRTPISGFSKLKHQLDRAMAPLAEADGTEAIPAWRLHDLRRTAYTGMMEIGVEPHIAEAVVNHISGHKAGVMGVYNRAKYIEPKRLALERWADHVQRIVSGAPAGKVLPMRRR